MQHKDQIPPEANRGGATYDELDEEGRTVNYNLEGLSLNLDLDQVKNPDQVRTSLEQALRRLDGTPES